MTQEIERKFIFPRDSTNLPQGSTMDLTSMLLRVGERVTSRDFICQDYLRIEKDANGDITEEERLRRVYRIGASSNREQYSHTVKRGQGESREEVEQKVKRKRYDRLMLGQKAGVPIKKIRSYCNIGEYALEIDMYLDHLHGLAICEIEFPDQQTSTDFQPMSLEGILGKEVTEDPRFANANLALSGRVPLHSI